MNFHISDLKADNMKNKSPLASPDSANDDTTSDRFPVPYSLDQFQHDIHWIYFLHLQMVDAIADRDATLRLIGKPVSVPYVGLCDLNELESTLGFTYADVRHTSLARSLESMYRFAYLGELDPTVEELGPGGYHIGIAALVRDLAASTHLQFCLWSAEDDYRDDVQRSITNCLNTMELANARLTLEGMPRFFNFESKGPEFDALITDGNTDTADNPQGGFGAWLTVRQMALLSGMGELSIRTLANPKRANQIPTESRFGRTLVPIEAAKAWLKERNRYVPIQTGVDGAGINLMRRRFVSLRELQSVVQTRLLDLSGEGGIGQFVQLAERHGFLGGDLASYTRPAFVDDLAALLAFDHALFALRVKEVLLVEALALVRRELTDATRNA